MASTAHGTLTAGAVRTVDIEPGEEGFVVVNRDRQGELWVRLDGQDPAIGGDGSYVVLGSRQFPMGRRERSRLTGGTLEVRLIADAARNYTVEAVR